MKNINTIENLAPNLHLNRIDTYQNDIKSYIFSFNVTYK